jgi:hypothetical protein
MTDVLQGLIDAQLVGRHQPAPAPAPPAADVAEQAQAFYVPEWRSYPLVLSLPGTPVTGAWVLGGTRFDFPVRSVRLDNLSGCRFVYSRQAPLYLPAYTIGFVAQTGSAEQVIDLLIDSAGATGPAVVTVFEQPLPPSAGIYCGPGPVALQAGTGRTATVSVAGANTLLAAPRAGRLGLFLLDTDPANAVRYNFDGVSTGALLAAGAGLPLGAYTGALYASPVAGSPAVDVTEVYN